MLNMKVNRGLVVGSNIFIGEEIELPSSYINSCIYKGLELLSILGALMLTKDELPVDTVGSRIFTEINGLV